MQAIGFPTYRYRLVCFVIAGTMCGLAGALLANHTEFVSPAMMHWTRSGDLIVMVVLGGMASTFGPLIGAVTLLVLEETLPIADQARRDAVRRRGGVARRGILADRARPAVPAGGAVRARRHQRAAWRACAVADALLADRRPDQALRRRDRLRRHRSRGAGGRAARHHRPERRRQDHADRPVDRRDRARRRPHSLRRTRHHRAAGLPAQPARARTLVPDHLAVQRFHRARQRGAGGAGARRAFVPFLARCAQGCGPARARARDAGAGRPRRPRERHRRRA